MFLLTCGAIQRVGWATKPNVEIGKGQNILRAIDVGLCSPTYGPSNRREAPEFSDVLGIVFVDTVFPFKFAPLFVLAKPQVSTDSKGHRECAKKN